MSKLARGLRLGRMSTTTAIAVAFCATSAEAAERSSLSCVGQALGRDAFNVIGENALRRNDRLPAEPVDQELDLLAQAVDRCRVREGWSDREATAAGLWVLNSARLEAVIAALKRDGISPDKAGEVVGRLSPVERRALLREPASQRALDALRTHAVEAGIPTEGLPAHHFVWFTTLLLKADQELARFVSR